MKKLTVVLAALLFSSIAHAGWVVGKDSDRNGVLRVSKNRYTKVISLERCDTIKGKCELLKTRSNFSVKVSQFFNHVQTGSAALGNVLPAVVGGVMALNPVGFYGGVTLAIEFSGSALLTYGGTKLVTIPKSLNVVRLYDYSSIYFNTFLMDDSSIVAFPDDTLEEIAHELI